VRGEPEESRLRTGAADDETEVAGEEGRKYVGVVGTKGGRGGRTYVWHQNPLAGGHAYDWWIDACMNLK
jgi:hypothetical protein